MPSRPLALILLAPMLERLSAQQAERMRRVGVLRPLCRG